MKKILATVALSVIFIQALIAQQPKKISSSEIYQSIKKLNFLGSALYIAAHPDDENTRLISYLSNEVHARTAYLSLTRGDGGQNLIGPEIRELLGVIRTNELLKAREVDGGEQFFSRANDFGYSKHPNETLQIWNKEEVLSDAVKIIREFQPDVIINRFDANSAGRTHGHHTSSAMISNEAFDLAANTDYQVNNLKPWKPRRLFYNISWWSYGSKEKFNKADKSKMLSVNTGTYYPWNGLSNTEVASLSRSMHKSQGFGSTGTRGDELEYLQLLKGDMPKNGLFDGINTTWTRIKGGDKIGAILNDVALNFDFKNPALSIPDLVKAYNLIQKLENEYWRNFKTEQIKEIIAACAGLYLEGKTNSAYATANDKVTLSVEVINRSDAKITLEKMEVLPEGKIKKVNKNLVNNKGFEDKQEIHISDKLDYTSPYWLNEEASLGMYHVKDKAIIGSPLSIPQLKIVFHLVIDNTPIQFEKNIVYKYNDPVKGEVYQPFAIVPAVAATVKANVVIFNDAKAKEIPVKVKSFKANTTGEVTLKTPKGWKIEPVKKTFHIQEKGGEELVTFYVTPTTEESEGYIQPIVTYKGNIYKNSVIDMNYDHIPQQKIVLPAKAKVVRLDLKTRGKNIAYIEGAGDEVPESLMQIGYNVDKIASQDISENSLKKYDAVIVGIRAYNTLNDLKFKQDLLFNFVYKGGNMIVQYNTSHALKINGNLAPYALDLSRDRVTDENAKVSFIDPENELLNYPNKISNKDFVGWVQERGLYFPNNWDKEFTPVLSMHDEGEKPKEGSLLIAKYGKGNYIYTGLSFFRELPAGVPGAYKLFANMISVGKNKTEEKIKK